MAFCTPRKRHNSQDLEVDTMANFCNQLLISDLLIAICYLLVIFVIGAVTLPLVSLCIYRVQVSPFKIARYVMCERRVAVGGTIYYAYQVTKADIARYHSDRSQRPLCPARNTGFY